MGVKDVSDGVRRQEGTMNLLRENEKVAKENLEAVEDTVSDETDPYGEFPRSTTGVIQIMRSKGRPEMADLVEDLYSAKKKVADTTKRAEDLLKLLRSLHKKATSTYTKVVVPSEPCGEDA